MSPIPGKLDEGKRLSSHLSLIMQLPGEVAFILQSVSKMFMTPAPSHSSWSSPSLLSEQALSHSYLAIDTEYIQTHRISFYLSRVGDTSQENSPDASQVLLTLIKSRFSNVAS